MNLEDMLKNANQIVNSPLGKVLANMKRRTIVIYAILGLTFLGTCHFYSYEKAQYLAYRAQVNQQFKQLSDAVDSTARYKEIYFDNYRNKSPYLNRIYSKLNQSRLSAIKSTYPFPAGLGGELSCKTHIQLREYLRPISNIFLQYGTATAPTAADKISKPSSEEQMNQRNSLLKYIAKDQQSNNSFASFISFIENKRTKYVDSETCLNY